MLAAITLVAFGPASPARADPGCQTNGVLEIFARKSGASLYPISDEAQAFFNDVGLALGSTPHNQVQIGDEDGDYGVVQSGEYPAIGLPWIQWPTYWGSVQIGVSELTGYLNQRAARCPNEAIVLGGHSQGADVVGTTLERGGLSDTAKSHIAYVALYGDPRNSGYLTGSSGGPAGIPPCFHGPWLQGNLQCGSSPVNGLLTARTPYVPTDFLFRTGGWCDAGDGMCTGNLASCIASGCGTHNTAYSGSGGWIQQSASTIADAARSRLSWMTYQPFPYNQLLPTMDASTLTLLSTFPHGTSSSGNPTANGSFVSYHGAVYRIAGGAPLYVSGSDASYPDLAGWSGATPITDAQWASLRQFPADGTYISDVATGAVYITAGGAPMYISGDDAPQLPNWTTALKVPHWDLVNWQHLRQFPADGYFLTDAQTGMVYETAGGAPLYVSGSDAPLLPQCGLFKPS